MNAIIDLKNIRIIGIRNTSCKLNTEKVVLATKASLGKLYLSIHEKTQLSMTHPPTAFRVVLNK